MSKIVRARFKSGMLELLDRVDLPEGKEVSITILDETEQDDVDAFKRSAGSWKGLVDADALIEQIYADRSCPSDRPVPRL